MILFEVYTHVSGCQVAETITTIHLLRSANPVVSCLLSFSGSTSALEKHTLRENETLSHPFQVYNHVNYTELKDYKYPECMGKAHDGNVRALVYVEEHTLLVSASGDRSISIHDDSKVNGTGRGLHRLPHYVPVDCCCGRCSNSDNPKRS